VWSGDSHFDEEEVLARVVRVPATLNDFIVRIEEVATEGVLVNLGEKHPFTDFKIFLLAT
jgi:hypothetical protein